MEAPCLISARVGDMNEWGWYFVPYFVNTPYNLDIFEKICFERRRLMSTCHSSRLVTIETWKREIEHLKLGDVWYDCMPGEGFFDEYAAAVVARARGYMRLLHE